MKFVPQPLEPWEFFKEFVIHFVH